MKQVTALEAFSIQTYSVAAEIARRANDIQEADSVWREMGDFCNEAIQALSQLKSKYPYCGTPQLYDRGLDYKIACDKRHRGILEEMECQRTTLPAGLFSTQN
ncbi:MAG TPA: hypothetical protein VL981_14835 [Candidatus Methylacidiphilales bacterium]|nr:hypothetical protein [Candidatus Methylacidiphilales bacterium]